MYGDIANTVLKSFGKEPDYIIDNSLCKINPKIRPVEFLKTLDPDKYTVILTIFNPDYRPSILYNLHKIWKTNKIIDLFEDYDVTLYRPSWLQRFAEIAYNKKISGNVAECGVFQGEFARFINEFFYDRKCYLFDSFEGFRSPDISVDKKFNHSEFFDIENLNSYKATSVDYVLSRMPYPDNVIVKKGYVPDTFDGVDDKFCFVSLDMDLYAPMFEALKFFYPKMTEGGIILLHDYYCDHLCGVEKAVRDYEELTSQSLCKIPCGDAYSLAILKN